MASRNFTRPSFPRAVMFTHLNVSNERTRSMLRKSRIWKGKFWRFYGTSRWELEGFLTVFIPGFWSKKSVLFKVKKLNTGIPIYLDLCYAAHRHSFVWSLIIIFWYIVFKVKTSLSTHSYFTCQISFLLCEKDKNWNETQFSWADCTQGMCNIRVFIHGRWNFIAWKKIPTFVTEMKCHFYATLCIHKLNFSSVHHGKY